MCVGCNPMAGVDCQRPTAPKKASPKPKAKKPKKGDRKKRDK